MLFKKGELKHLRMFYLADFIHSISAVILPFMIIFFRDMSLSFKEIGVMLAGYAITTFLFEVPTGAFADAYSRKASVIFSIITSSIIVIFFAFANGFWSFLILWCLLGVSLSFETGAYSAWVIGNLNKKKRKDLHQEFFIKSRSLSALGFVIAPLIGSLLIKQFSYTGLWLFFAAGGFMVSFIVMTIPEYYKPKKVSIKNAMKENFVLAKKGFKHVLKNKSLLYLFIAAIFLSFMGLADDGWQPFFVELGAPVHYLGYFYSIMAVALIGIPFLSNLFKKYKVKYVLSISYIISAALLLGVLYLQPGMFWYALIPFVLLSGVDMFAGPIGETYMHRFIKENIRATVVSIKSMVLVSAAAIVVLVGGALMDVLPIPLVMSIGAFFVLGAIWAYSKLED